MTIIEQSVIGKHNAESCEDGIVVSRDFVAVIDGSTSKTSKRINPDMSNGRYAMTVIADFITHLPADASLESFCDGITAKIHSLYPSDDSLEREHPEERLCAVAVVYSNYRKEIWMIGDCQCMVDGEMFSNGKPVERVIASKRAALFNQMKAMHPDMIDNGYIVHDYARDAILPELVNSMKGENKTYAVIDGFPIYKDGIKKIPCKGKSVVLASDGYPFLYPTLAKSEKKLARQIATDPFNIDSFKATKGLMKGNVSFDDRAYIRFSTTPAQRYFLTLSFDGTDYHGWQIQPNSISVQERVEDGLSKILRQEMSITGAGRTDAGVHARTMVCHFDSSEDLDCQQLVYRLNQILPQDISCNDIRPVNGDMHARFSAKKRTYRYFIHTNKSPFERHYSVETHYQLDFALMNEAASFLTTVTDFKAFCKAGADNKTTICNVSKAQWVQTGQTTWYFEISADRFLRNMVRAIVGTLFDVGRHRITLKRFKEIVLKGGRTDSGESMPAKGLFLWEIEY